MRKAPGLLSREGDEPSRRVRSRVLPKGSLTDPTSRTFLPGRFSSYRSRSSRRRLSYGAVAMRYRSLAIKSAPNESDDEPERRGALTRWWSVGRGSISGPVGSIASTERRLTGDRISGPRASRPWQGRASPVPPATVVMLNADTKGVDRDASTFRSPALTGRTPCGRAICDRRARGTRDKAHAYQRTARPT